MQIITINHYFRSILFWEISFMIVSFSYEIFEISFVPLGQKKQLMQIVSLYIFNDDVIRIRFRIKKKRNRNNSNLRKISDFVIYCCSIPLITLLLNIIITHLELSPSISSDCSTSDDSKSRYAPKSPSL